MLTDERKEELALMLLWLLTEYELDIIDAFGGGFDEILTAAVDTPEIRRILHREGVRAADVRKAITALSSDRSFTRALQRVTADYVNALDNAGQRTGDAIAEAIYNGLSKAAADCFDDDVKRWLAAGQIPPDASPYLVALINRYVSQAQEGVINLTQTTAIVYGRNNTPITAAYTAELDRALIDIVLNKRTKDECVRDVVKAMAARGVKRIDYESGYHLSIDAAAELCLRTTTQQLTGDICQKNCEQTGVEYVEVSGHWGARPSHALWQGQVYSMEDFKRICGYQKEPMTEDQIYSWNCRHVHYPFWKGISTPNEWPPEPEPKEWRGREYTYYQAEQKQRAYERKMRGIRRQYAAMRRLGGAAANSAAADLRAEYRRIRAEYEAFSNAVDIKAAWNRIYADGLGVRLL